MAGVTQPGGTGGEPDAIAAPARAVGVVLSSALVATVATATLAIAAQASAVDVLVVIAVLQGLLALAWMLGLARPGRIGGIVIAAMAAAAADTTLSVWPQDHLGPLLPVFAVALPVLFIHQLWRGAARKRVIESLGAIAVLLIGELGLPALVQLWHEFDGGQVSTDVVSAIVVSGGAGLVLAALIDLGVAAPRFDPAVRRGLLAVVAAAVLGGLLGYLILRQSAEFSGGRGAFVGASVAALVALFAVAVSFAEQDANRSATGPLPALRPVVGALLPLCLVAPIALLICLAIRA
jgi:hypothetical protein